MELGFEQAFREEYRKSQRALAWKYLGLIFLGAAAVMLVQVFWLRGGRWYWFDLVLPGIMVVLDLWLALMHRGQQRWMARDFCLTEEGILEQDLRGRKRLVPWSMVIAVDKGTMAGFEQRSVPVIRCFLSSSAWEKFTPNLRQSSEKTSMQDYCKLRKECFVIEYSPEREQMILHLWEGAGADERDEPVKEPIDGLKPSDEAEYTFDETSRSVWKVTFGGILCVAILFGIGIPAVALFSGAGKDGLLGAVAVGFVLIFFSLGLLWMESPCGRWLCGKCKICREGIHVHAF